MLNTADIDIFKFFDNLNLKIDDNLNSIRLLPKNDNCYKIQRLNLQEDHETVTIYTIKDIGTIQVYGLADYNLMIWGEECILNLKENIQLKEGNVYKGRYKLRVDRRGRAGISNPNVEIYSKKHFFKREQKTKSFLGFPPQTILKKSIESYLIN